MNTHCWLSGTDRLHVLQLHKIVHKVLDQKWTFQDLLKELSVLLSLTFTGKNIPRFRSNCYEDAISLRNFSNFRHNKYYHLFLRTKSSIWFVYYE